MYIDIIVKYHCMNEVEKHLPGILISRVRLYL